jgi:hypothetical protein
MHHWVSYSGLFEIACILVVVVANLAWTDWKSKPPICHERPATDRLSYDTFSYLSYDKINHTDFEFHIVDLLIKKS